MLGIVFGPFILCSDQHSSLLLSDDFLTFRNYNKTDLMTHPAITNRVKVIGSIIEQPIEEFLTAKPMNAVQANYELFLYAFFSAIADFVIAQEQPNDTVFAFISSGIFPALAAANAMSIDSCFMKLRPIYNRYFRKATQDMKAQKSFSLILEADADTDAEVRALQKSEDFRNHIFTMDRRGPFSYSLCGNRAKLRQFKDRLMDLPVKCSHIFETVSSHTPACRAFVWPAKIRSVPFSQSHDKLLINKEIERNLGTMDRKIRQHLIDQQIRGPMDTYGDFELLSSISEKIIYIGGRQTALIAKTFLRNQDQSQKVILI